jgi:uncharacterized protein YjbJ (UPF0337 family)
MLNETQQQLSIPGITGGTVVVLLQIIARLVGSGGIKDAELSTIGTARDQLKGQLQEATGVDFDTERAKQEQQVRQLQAAARQRQEDAQKAAAEAAEAVESAGEATTPAAVEAVEEAVVVAEVAVEAAEKAAAVVAVEAAPVVALVEEAEVPSDDQAVS